jgi:hypothetical protein
MLMPSRALGFGYAVRSKWFESRIFITRYDAKYVLYVVEACLNRNQGSAIQTDRSIQTLEINIMHELLSPDTFFGPSSKKA